MKVEIGNRYYQAFKAYNFTWLRQSDAARALGTKVPNIAVMLRRGFLSGININGTVFVSMKSIEFYLLSKQEKEKI